MKRLVLLKRALFWLEASVSIVIVLAAGVILVWVFVLGLASDSMGVWLQEIGSVFAYFVDIAIKIILTEPRITITTLFWVSVYVGTTIYFAQTDSENRICKYLIPLTLSCAPFCAMAGFGMAIAKLG